MEQEKAPKRMKIQFPDIHPTAFQHPADRVALRGLQKVPGIDIALRTFFGSTTERSLRLVALASAVRVSEKQFARVHGLFLEACRILDVKEKPELYIAQNPFLNAGAVGMDRPFITLNSALVESTTDEELLGVIGHELGHVMSGHVLYKSLLALMLRISTLTLNIPLSGVAIAGIIAALKEWDRKSELSADRAELLVTQDVEVSNRLLMKMAGGNRVHEMDLGEFIKQAEEYRNSGNVMDNMYKILNILGQSHPFPVLRLTELIDWVRSGEYENILHGHYNKEEKPLSEDAKQASEEYAKGFRETMRPLGETWDQATEKAKEIFSHLMGPGATPPRNEN